MTIKELLEEAARRYPVGTRYWNLNAVGERSRTYIANKPHLLLDGDAIPFVETEDFNGKGPIIARGNNNGYVYSGGKWAEIVDYQCSVFN